MTAEVAARLPLDALVQSGVVILGELSGRTMADSAARQQITKAISDAAAAFGLLSADEGKDRTTTPTGR